MTSEDQIRAAWVEIATSYDGCSVSTHRQRFLDLVVPHGPEEWRGFFAQRVPGAPNSSCGVVSIGLLRELCRRFGLIVNELEGPLPRDWATPVIALAKRHGCYHVPSGGKFPTVGCAYYVAIKIGDVTHQHWRNVVGGTPGSGPFDTIDGGQLDGAGFQCVAKMRPQLRGAQDVTSNKPIVFWIDCVRLVFALLAKAGAAGLPGAPFTVSGEAPNVPAAPSSTPIEGIDVASIQGAIDWKRVAAAGIRFAYVRALLGRDDVDTRAAANCAGALAAGLDVGVYGVTYPRRAPRAQDADIQAAQLANLHRKFGCTLRPMMDVETLPKLDPTPDEWARAVSDYGLALEDEGLPPILYTYPAFWRALGSAGLTGPWTRYPLWIAHYTKAPKPDVPPPWSKPLVWQYLASAPGFEGRVDGVSTLVDRNRLYGSLDDLRVRTAPTAA